ncbi:MULTISPECIES: DUF6731 family protein [Staphylococcus]|jgi:hypothetical protein|uniref:DUF6731 family protein n=1 Tax=Staphylococcus TaxID=1279 RepID=UPI000409D5AD|nr:MULTISPECIES: DUF6731 family protein [Staphylococcus]MBB2508424.1 hypothetical protein [Staphylococcus cohnii subsp. barensis]MDW4368209.1 hypothetical protein [Staphylococcus saprophyticus]OEK12263.1 hypothetical protein ASS79_02995 [Staphylococcus saprophyticus]
MSKQKLVNINVFYSCELLDEKNCYYIDLSELLDRIKNKYEEDNLYKEVVNLNNDPIRIKKIHKEVDTGYYHIVMERLDDTKYSKTTLYGDPIDIGLENNEYISHEISILYDPAKKVLLIQRNISSLSPSGIEKFLRTLYLDYYEEDIFYNLVTAVDERARTEALNKPIYRKINFKVTGESTNDLLSVVSENEYEGVESIEITITTNRSPKAELDNDTTKKILNKWVDNQEVEKLKVDVKEDAEQTVENIDLLKHALRRSMEYTYSDSSELNSDRIFDDMKNMYRNGDDALSLKV